MTTFSRASLLLDTSTTLNFLLANSLAIASPVEYQWKVKKLSMPPILNLFMCITVVCQLSMCPALLEAQYC